MPPMPPIATDPVTSAGSILGIVLSGVQLGTQLQTYMELAQEAEEELHDIVFDINATSAALKQLHTIIDNDRNAQDPTTNIFKDDGVREIEMLALKCDAIYKNIIMLIQRASHSESGSKGSGHGSVPEASNMALDPSTLKPLNFIRKLRWPWLRPRILRCHEQLNWLKVSLLFTLQMANIAQWQMSNRQAGISEEIKFNQKMAEKLQERRREMLHEMVDTEKEEQQRADVAKRDFIMHAASTPSVPPYDVESTKARKRSTSITLDDSNVDMDSLAHVDSFSSRQAEDTIISEETNPTSFADSSLTVNSNKMPGATPFMMFPSIPQPTPSTPRGKVVSTRPAFAFKKKLSAEPCAPVPAPAPAPVPDTSRDRSTVNPQKLPDRFGHWADTVFGRQRKYRNDEQSGALEAYIAENDGCDAPIKIPFGHNRLSYGLDKVLKDWHGDPWTNYLALSPAKRLAIDAITETARKSSNHEKSCLAFKEYSTRGSTRPFLLVFFALSEAKDPIILHLEGRRYRLPFAACRTLQDVERRIHEVCHSSPAHLSLVPLVEEKRYEFSDASRNIILPRFLMESIKPGIELSLSPQPHVPRQVLQLSAACREEIHEKSDWRRGGIEGEESARLYSRPLEEESIKEVAQTVAMDAQHGHAESYAGKEEGKKYKRKNFFAKIKKSMQSRAAPLSSHGRADMSRPVLGAAQREKTESVLTVKEVDYLSHRWKEEEILATWRYMFVAKGEPENSNRLKNALWRAWVKAQQSLKTAAPVSFDWVKNFDGTWLYGPMLESFDDKLVVSKTASLQKYKTKRKAHSIDFGVLPQRIKESNTGTQPQQITGNKPERGTSRVPISTGSRGWEPPRTVPTSSVFNEAVLSKHSGPAKKSDEDPVRKSRGRSDSTTEVFYGDSRSPSEVSDARARSRRHARRDSEGVDYPRRRPENISVYERDSLEERPLRLLSRYSDSLRSAPYSDRSYSPVPVDCAAEARAEGSSGRLSFDDEAEHRFSVAPHAPYKMTAAQPSSSSLGVPRPTATKSTSARVSSLAKHFEQLSREFEKQRARDREEGKRLFGNPGYPNFLQKMAVETPMRPPSPAPLASGDFVHPHPHEMPPHQASSLSPVPSELSYREVWEGSEDEPARDDVSFDGSDLDLDVLDMDMETAKGDVEMRAWLERMTNAVGVDWTTA